MWPESEQAKSEQAKSEQSKSEQLKFPQITASSIELFFALQWVSLGWTLHRQGADPSPSSKSGALLLMGCWPPQTKLSLFSASRRIILMTLMEAGVYHALDLTGSRMSSENLLCHCSFAQGLHPVGILEKALGLDGCDPRSHRAFQNCSLLNFHIGWHEKHQETQPHHCCRRLGKSGEISQVWTRPRLHRKRAHTQMEWNWLI